MRWRVNKINIIDAIVTYSMWRIIFNNFQIMQIVLQLLYIPYCIVSIRNEFIFFNCGLYWMLPHSWMWLKKIVLQTGAWIWLNQILFQFLHWTEYMRFEFPQLPRGVAGLVTSCAITSMNWNTCCKERAIWCFEQHSSILIYIWF